MKKQKMFKLMALFLSFFILTQPTGFVYASSNNNETNNVKQKAISSHDKYVKDNIQTFISNEDTPSKEANLQGDKGDCDIPMYQVNSSELYDDNGNSLDIKAVTYAYEISNNTLAATGGGSHYAFKEDDSISYLGYITVYYSTESYLGNDLYTVTSATGGYTVYDHTVSVTSQGVTFLELGVGKTGTAVAKQKVVKLASTASSWTAYSYFTVGIFRTGTYTFGAQYNINLKHGTSTWTLNVDGTF